MNPAQRHDTTKHFLVLISGVIRRKVLNSVKCIFIYVVSVIVKVVSNFTETQILTLTPF